MESSTKIIIFKLSKPDNPINTWNNYGIEDFNKIYWVDMISESRHLSNMLNQQIKNEVLNNRSLIISCEDKTTPSIIDGNILPRIS